MKTQESQLQELDKAYWVKKAERVVNRILPDLEHLDYMISLRSALVQEVVPDQDCCGDNFPLFQNQNELACIPVAK